MSQVDDKAVDAFRYGSHFQAILLRPSTSPDNVRVRKGLSFGLECCLHLLVVQPGQWLLKLLAEMGSTLWAHQHYHQTQLLHSSLSFKLAQGIEVVVPEVLCHTATLNYDGARVYGREHRGLWRKRES